MHGIPLLKRNRLGLKLQLRREIDQNGSRLSFAVCNQSAEPDALLHPRGVERHHRLMRNAGRRIANPLCLMVSDRSWSPLRQLDEIKTESLRPPNQIHILNRPREHFLVISAERDKMMLRHSDAAISSIIEIAGESLNNGIRVVRPESSVPPQSYRR